MAQTKGSKTSFVPARPFERSRLVSEMKMLGDFGLRNKRELYIFTKICNDLKKKASKLLITNDSNKFAVEARALLNKLQTDGVLNKEIDYNDKTNIVANLENVLNLGVENFLERRLQQIVLNLGLANSIHQARTHIKNRYIKVGDNVVDRPGFIVRRESEGYIQYSEKYNKMMKKAAKKNKNVEEEN